MDTAQDILDRGLKVFAFPGGGSVVKMLKNSPFPLTRRIAEITRVAKVIFSILTNGYFIQNFLIIRIGMIGMIWLKMRLGPVLLLLSVASCMTMNWSMQQKMEQSGTEARRRSLAITHMLLSC